jgi:hypothetical protein
VELRELIFIGRRPTAANFRQSRHLRRLRTASVLSPTEVQADDRLRADRAHDRDDPLHLPSIARAIGQATTPYAIEAAGETRYRAAFFGLMANRLSLLDGSAESSSRGDGIPALERYRLVYEGGARTSGGYVAEGRAIVIPAEISFAKIFERVEGALLTGRADPFARVEVSLDLVTNRAGATEGTTDGSARRCCGSPRDRSRGRRSARRPYRPSRSRSARGGRRRSRCRAATSRRSGHPAPPSPSPAGGGGLSLQAVFRISGGRRRRVDFDRYAHKYDIDLYKAIRLSGEQEYFARQG